MKKIRTSLFLLIFCVSTNAWAQEISINGTVSDGKDGTTLPGVSVIVRGTKIGTQTDVQGRYQIKVPSSDSELEFRFIGYQTQIVKVNGRTRIDVALQQLLSRLEEVTVTTTLGQERKRNELPFSAQSIGADELNRTGDPNFISSLRGKIAGLDISQTSSMGGFTRMVIRGPKSFFGNNQALVVIDGIPFNNSSPNSSSQERGTGGYDYGNPASDINSNDIESINVLKGAAATALYGSRASNGAIIITTKKRKSKEPGFSASFNVGFTTGSMDKTTFIKFQNEYGAGYGPGYGSPDKYFWYKDVDGDGQKDLVVPLSEDASYGARFDPNLMVYHWDAFDPTSPNYQKKRPWVAAKHDPTSFFETPFTLLTSFNVDAGNEKGFYKLGFSRNADKGILPRSNLTKNTLNFAVSHQLIKPLTLIFNSNFSRVTGNGRYGTGYDPLNVSQNFRQWWQMNVDVLEQKEAYFRSRKNITWNFTDIDDMDPIYWDNPYWVRFENFQNDDRNRIWGNFGFDWEIANWMTASARVSIDNYDQLLEERIAVSSHDVANYTRENRSFTEYNYDFLLNLKRKLSDDFSLTGLMGVNIRRSKSSIIIASTNGGLWVPRLYSLANTESQPTPPVESFYRVGVDGILGSANLAYKDFLFLDLTGRRDESTTLPKNSSAYFYPSVATSLLFSKLLPNQQWLNYGKIRLNYAEVGSSAPALSINDVYDVIPLFGKVPRFSIPPTKNNPYLKPERTRSIEGGIELGFWNNRLGADFTLYRQNSIDQIVPIPVSTATGYSRKYVNTGTIRNQGVELILNGTPVLGNRFSWNVSLNFSQNRNKVIQLNAGKIQLGSFQGGVSINADLNQPYGILNGTNFIYHQNGQRIVDDTGHYLVTPKSDQLIGDTNPRWTGGVTNTLRFGEASLTFLVDASKGGSIFSLDRSYGLSTGLPAETAGLNDLGNPSRLPLDQGGGIILPGVKSDGSPNDIRIPNVSGTYGYETQPNAAFVYDASYVKLREVSLSYALPDRWISKIKGLKTVQLSLVGRNLWIIHKNLPDADPEDGLSSDRLRGYQVGSYPTYRTYGFNIHVNF